MYALQWRSMLNHLPDKAEACCQHAGYLRPYTVYELNFEGSQSAVHPSTDRAAQGSVGLEILARPHQALHPHISLC